MKKTLQKYHFGELISRKAGSRSHLASSDDALSSLVVIKVFDALRLTAPQREIFLQRAERLTSLRHASLLPIEEVGVEEEHPYIVSAYATGGSLRERLDQERLPWQEAVWLLVQIGEALTYAHEQGMTHGNLKPENVLFNAENAVQLADFSLAPFLEGLLPPERTEKQNMYYLAPEQFAGTTTAASDQYALACLAYELFTGRPPFKALAWSTMRTKHASERPAPLTASNLHLPSSVNRAVLQALAKDPAARYSDVSVFIGLLRAAAEADLTFSLNTLADTDRVQALYLTAGSLASVPAVHPQSGDAGKAHQSGRLNRHGTRGTPSSRIQRRTWLAALASVLVIFSLLISLQYLLPHTARQTRPTPTPHQSVMQLPPTSSALTPTPALTMQPTPQATSPVSPAPTPISVATPQATSAPVPTTLPTAAPTPTVIPTPVPTAAPTPTPIPPTPTPTPEPVITNLALNQPASSSANESTSLGPGNAVDGNLSTRWSSAWSDSQWLEVDLGATHTITEVKLHWETAYARTYLIQISSDGSNWTTIEFIGDGHGGTEDFPNLQVSGRYVRMFGLHRATQWGYSLWEFEVDGY